MHSVSHGLWLHYYILAWQIVTFDWTMLVALTLRGLRLFGTTRIDVFDHRFQLTNNLKIILQPFRAVACEMWISSVFWCGVVGNCFMDVNFSLLFLSILVRCRRLHVPVIPPFVPPSYWVIVNYLSFHFNPSTRQIDRYICHTAHFHLSVRNLV